MNLQVRVQPKAKRNSVEVDGQRVVVRVTAPPEDGRANDAVIALLARRLGIAKSRILVIRGHKSRDKQLRIEELTTEEVFARLSTQQ